MVDTYDDGSVRIDEDGITLRRYWFPTMRAKHLAYDEVTGYDVEPLRWSRGRGRLWGSPVPLDRWLPLDARRPGRTSLVVLHVGRRVHPAFTPADPDRAVAALASHLPPR